MQKQNVNAARKAVSGMALAALAAISIGCAKESSARPQSPPAESARTDVPEVLATVGDQRITLADLRERVGFDLDRIEAQYLRTRSKIIDTTLRSLVRERVLSAEAQKQGKTVEQLLAGDGGAVAEPTDVEIAAWFQVNQARLQGRTLDQLRPQIADYLRTERKREAAQKLEERLGKAVSVTFNFEPYRVTLDNAGAAAMGNPNARVTVVEFSDFQCPYCRGFAPIMKQLEQKYGDKIHIVYRQYPIASLHPFAFKAAEASLCANEQGKFWELHDLMFAEQQKLAVADLKEKARRLGMDQRKFDGCLDSGRHVERIQNDLKEGARVGVTGTPAVYINGVVLDGGAVPLEAVSAAIDREFARVKP
jgi:protein-disulfide isomerase